MSSKYHITESDRVLLHLIAECFFPQYLNKMHKTKDNPALAGSSPLCVWEQQTAELCEPVLTAVDTDL